MIKYMLDNNITVIGPRVLDKNGNFLIINLEINKMNILLIVVYGPNKDEPDFYKSLFSKIISLYITNIIIVGDWNLLLNPQIDGVNYKHINNPRARIEVLKLMNDLSLYDVWREENHDTRLFTWRRRLENGKVQQGRLDFFLVSESLLNFTQGEKILPGYRSDHSIIEINLNFNNEGKGKTFWKFNNSLLYNSDFSKEVKDVIIEVKTRYAASPYNKDKIKDIENEHFETTINPQLFLEMLLLEIRGKSIAFSAAVRKKERERENEIIKEIDILEKKDDVDLEKVSDLKRMLQNIREKKLKGMLIRS